MFQVSSLGGPLSGEKCGREELAGRGRGRFESNARRACVEDAETRKPLLVDAENVRSRVYQI